MFERLKNAWRAAPESAEGDDGLARWAADRLLSHRRLASGVTLVEGLLNERAFRAACAPSSRPYIVGVELMAKIDLGIRDDVNVIVMHRALKRALDKAVGRLAGEVAHASGTGERSSPEEMMWVSVYRDAGWPGPSPSFWSRYCVLTDAPVAAQDWLDDEAIERLIEMPDGLRATTPFLIALTRGKLSLRLQLEARDDGMVSHPALDILEYLSGRAAKRFGHC